VAFRSLSRAEALHLNDYRGREDEAEVFIIACATEASEDEVRTWRGEVDTDTAGLLIDAILVLSGLAERDAEGIVAPKVRPSRPSLNGH
jgi:hypothetical protein